MTRQGTIPENLRRSLVPCRSVDADALQRAIRSQVASHMVDAERERSGAVGGVLPHLVLDALLATDTSLIGEVVATLVSHDVSLDLFHRAILVPVAERMGEMWCDDEINFVMVEILSMRMRMMLNRFVELQRKTAAHREYDPRRSIIVADAHGAGHDLGISLVEAFFRDAGWDVEGGAHQGADNHFFDRLARREFAVVALGMTSGHAQEDRIIVERSRAVSANSSVLVCVGGPAVRQNPTIYQDWGVDIIAMDAPDALRRVEEALAA